MAAQNEQRPERIKTTPYLEGDVLSSDSGPLLSVFALQEIMQKVRQVQADYMTATREVDFTVPDVQKILDDIKALAAEQVYKIVKVPSISFRHIVMQSRDRVLRVDTYYEEMSQVGDVITEDEPEKFYSTIIKKVRFIRGKGSFILHDIPTRDHRGMEVAEPEVLGVEFKNVLPVLTAEHRAMIQNALDGSIIENGNVATRDVDVFIGACSEPIYRIYNRLQGYIEAVQLQELRNSIGWLERLGQRKRITYSQEVLTDFRRQDTIWVLALQLPVNPQVVWDVPRSSIANLIMNIATCLPTGEYIAPNPRISSITLTQRITTTGPFAILTGSTPTAQQLNDVRKIYLALMFPGQIILDLKIDPGERMDPAVRMVAGVVGHLLFTAGGRFTNLTQNMARQLDIALNDYLLYMYNTRVQVNYGPTGEPLDFQIGRNQYDCNVFRADFATGTGYNGWATIDVEYRDPAPYVHAQRYIRYCGIDSRELINPTTYGIGMTYHCYNEMLRMLVAAGKDSEAAYFRSMLPFHMVRFARINQIINEDLHSVFSLPDDMFNALLPDLIAGAHQNADPVVLDVSWISLWFAFNRSFEPTHRNEMLEIAPLIESVYASELSVMKVDMRHLSLMQRRFPDVLIQARPSHFWKAVLNDSPEAVKAVMNLSHSHNFINIRDMMRWVLLPSLQPSLKLVLEEEAWAAANDFEDLMLTDQVYMHRDMLPEPRLDDIERFRQEGFYYTNMLEAPPEIDRVVQYTYEIARLQANMGQFRAALRRIMDDDDWVRFGGVLRTVRVKFFDARPPDDILQGLPFSYDTNEKGGLSYATIKYATETTIFYLIYNVEFSNTPDSLVLINPTYTMTKVFINKRIVERVRVGQILAVLNRRFVAYKGKMRIMDITQSLKMGTKLAAPTV
ncbi:inner core protein [Bluetongue virus 8]|uniref:Inner core protein n=17 Tax=Bluetongue virus TaxID=40051 RepID=R4J9P3_BTV8|nr:VP3 [Corsican bluetongue virus]ABA60743.1 inner core structural protein VP3 [Bluetongue virus 1]ABA60746.1 inner core structural protein VP3 [Bluetongue virus 9]ABA60764.1 inner core structural protein VP3 [Bluetongue virus 4]ABA60766.1 inner core structural protein VP3 [Bluetongue virus 2]ABA60770.1 inner core structural protein VP3 [Bluetongue virus 16]ACR58460.1 VP3 [Bluetongue virus]AFN71132.1 inner capsid protein VP3 [Bluetongue virus 11]AGJ83463.1 VP3 [Bluetongue virus 6]AGJ83473.